MRVRNKMGINAKEIMEDLVEFENKHEVVLDREKVLKELEETPKP